MILALCLLIGLALRVVTGRGMRTLADVHLVGEGWLIGLLLAQAVVPALQFTGSAARIAYFAWLATFPLMVGVAFANRKAPGMAVLGVGLLLNLIVIATNGGMPVFGAAATMVTVLPPTFQIPANDFVHVLGAMGTGLPWLADVVPLPGPAWLRAVASPGDLLLFVGIVAFLSGAEKMRPKRVNAGKKQE